MRGHHDDPPAKDVALFFALRWHFSGLVNYIMDASFSSISRRLRTFCMPPTAPWEVVRILADATPCSVLDFSPKRPCTSYCRLCQNALVCRKPGCITKPDTPWSNRNCNCVPAASARSGVAGLDKSGLITFLTIYIHLLSRSLRRPATCSNHCVGYRRRGKTRERETTRQAFGVSDAFLKGNDGWQCAVARMKHPCLFRVHIPRLLSSSAQLRTSRNLFGIATAHVDARKAAALTRSGRG